MTLTLPLTACNLLNQCWILCNKGEMLLGLVACYFPFFFLLTLSHENLLTFFYSAAYYVLE